MYGVVTWVLKRIFKLLGLIFFIIFLTHPVMATTKFLVLCYHDVPIKPSSKHDVSLNIFVRQMEYLKTHGYHVISPKDILAAASEQKKLPEKSVLLTFDDAYLSFYNYVYPILKIYNYPAVLSVVSSWIEKKPDYVGHKELMSWKQIKEVTNSGLVFLASHTHDLHKGVIYTPQGNIGPATSTFIYNQKTKSYENKISFRKRIKNDLKKSIEIIKEKTGVTPVILTWPYGEFNEIALEEAKKLGFKMMLMLGDGYAELNQLDRIRRNVITNEMGLVGFIERIKEGFKTDERIRAVQIDLDLIVNPTSFKESEYNLGLLIERLLKLGVNTVFIQAFCDKDGSGNIKSVYFQNHILPVEMDFLAYAVHRIMLQNIKVYVWMPVLSFELPNEKLNESLKIKEFKNGEIKTTTSWYRRLSPFAEESLRLIKCLYEDLAAHVRFHGVLFQDDAYLTDFEDFHPEAIKFYQKELKIKNISEIFENEIIKQKWTQLKIKILDNFTKELEKIVKKYRPNAKFARNIYSRVIFEPESKEWFCQDFNTFLKNYDYTAIMAYPQMENIYGMKKIRNWLLFLVNQTKKYSKNLDKCIFKIQTYDWSKNKWIKEKQFKKELRILLSLGVKHIGYYPDNIYEDKPNVEKVATITSGKYFPFKIK